MVSASVTLGESGRILLPANIRKELGLEAGDCLTILTDDGEIRIFSQAKVSGVLDDASSAERLGVSNDHDASARADSARR
jgi:AbrB family looped-hinge helix DNA binding protein